MFLKTRQFEDIVQEMGDNDLVYFNYGHCGLAPLLETLNSVHDDARLDVIMPFLRFTQTTELQLGNFIPRPGLRLLSPLPVPEHSKIISEKGLTVLPLTYSGLYRYINGELGRRRVWIILEVSPPQGGFCSSGYVVFFPKGTLTKARTIGMVNSEIPITHGDSLIPTTAIREFTELSKPELPLLAPHPEGETSRRIARNVAELVEDGSTIHIGVGSALATVCNHLKSKEALTVHTGLLHPRIWELVESGVVTGTCHAHVAVPTSSQGYRWMNNNKVLEMKSIGYIYDASVMSRLKKFHALNSAIYIDLNGQVVATTIGSQIVSGIGGLLDSARGAKLSKGGKSVVAVESTYKNGSGSNIRATVSAGDWVALTCYDVDYVVTEHGVAKLTGKSREERTKELIEVADPNFRQDLRSAQK